MGRQVQNEELSGWLSLWALSLPCHRASSWWETITQKEMDFCWLNGHFSFIFEQRQLRCTYFFPPEGSR